MLPLLASLASSSDQKMFRGYWSANITLKTGQVVNDSARFFLTQDPAQHIEGFSFSHNLVTFANSTHLKFGTQKLPFNGLIYNNLTSYYLFNVFSPAFISENLSLSIMREVITANHLEDPYDPLALHSYIQAIFSTNTTSIKISSLFFNLTEGVHSTEAFQLDSQISGYLIGTTVNMTIKANQFDIVGYITEGKLFGVAAAVGVVLTFYAWLSLGNNFQTNAALTQLSLHSFILHIGCDFSYALFILDLSMISSQLSLLYSFLFLSLISIYFGIQMKQLALIWRAHNDNIGDADTTAIRTLFCQFFVEVGLLMSIASIAMSSVFDNPIFSLAFLSSAVLPQIIHSAINPIRKTADTVFIILISIARMIPLLYFTIYTRNVMGSYSPKAAIIVGAWIAFQGLFVICQNIFGGDFFVPKALKRVPFDYHSSVPEPGTECAICMSVIRETDDCVMTPCRHGFHTECLSRWMQEQLICPICRSPLPPLPAE